MCDWEDDDGVYFCNQVKKKKKEIQRIIAALDMLYFWYWIPKKNLREQSAHETENKSCDHDNQVHCLSVFWRKPSFYTETE